MHCFWSVLKFECIPNASLNYTVSEFCPHNKPHTTRLIYDVTMVLSLLDSQPASNNNLLCGFNSTSFQVAILHCTMQKLLNYSFACFTATKNELY